MSETNTVTIEQIQSKIKDRTFTLLPGGTTTICVAKLENGFQIIGKSACVDPKNYNKDLGEQYAAEDAISQIWPLEGYLLAQSLFEQNNKLPDGSFSQALIWLKQGKRVARSGWNGKGMWLSFISKDKYTTDVLLTLLPWIGMKTADNQFVPWLASQTDLLADDWVVFEGELNASV